jgi:hypothetical protein
MACCANPPRLSCLLRLLRIPYFFFKKFNSIDYQAKSYKQPHLKPLQFEIKKLTLYMPKIAVYKFLTFFIYAFDAINEPPHLHIVKEKGNRQRSAKIWIETLRVVEKGTLNDKELNQAINLIRNNQTVLIESFNKVKNGQKITTLKLK